MAYIGFDLDETLGSFSSAHAHVFFVAPESLYQTILKGWQPFPPSEGLRERLQQALNEFAKCLLAKEPELLRPGILDILSKLAALKESGQVKAMSIYSNNGNLGLLLLASTMIETALGKPGLFCNHIDWYSPLRTAEITPGRPGVATKTLAVLKKSFLDARCGAIDEGKMYFFDDLQPPHPDLYSKLTPERYFVVNPYKGDPASLDTIDACLDSALKTARLDVDTEFLNYVAPIVKGFGGASEDTPYETIFTVLKKFNRGYKPEQRAFMDDTASLLERIDTAFPPSSVANTYGENYFPVVDGGRRRLKRHIRKTIKKRNKKLRKRHSRARKN